MAKMKRVVLGSLVKSKDPNKASYIKLSKDVVLKEGQYLNVESKKFQLASLEGAVAAGRLSGENAEKARERIEKMPDFVLGDVILLVPSAG